MKLKHVLLTSILAMGFALTASAHGEAKGPHGGTIVEMPPYHTEFEVMNGMLHIYVLGEKDKPVSAKDMEGSIVIQFPGGKKVKEKLGAMGDALMISAQVGHDKEFVAIATIKMKGKAYIARYSHKVSKKTEHDNDHH